MAKSSRVKSIPALVLSLGISLLSCSCTSLRPGEKYVKDIREERLGFIKLGKTTRNEVTHKLGPPTFTLRDNSIFVYRFCLNNRRRPTPESLGWHNDFDLEAATPNFRVQMGGNVFHVDFMNHSNCMRRLWFSMILPFFGNIGYTIPTLLKTTLNEALYSRYCMLFVVFCDIGLHPDTHTRTRHLGSFQQKTGFYSAWIHNSVRRTGALIQSVSKAPRGKILCICWL